MTHRPSTSKIESREASESGGCANGFLTGAVDQAEVALDDNTLNLDDANRPQPQLFPDGTLGDETHAKTRFDATQDGLGRIELHRRTKRADGDSGLFQSALHHAAGAGAALAHQQRQTCQ